MRWYVNDASLQAQFHQPTGLHEIIQELVLARSSVRALQTGLYTTRSLPDRLVRPDIPFRLEIQQSSNADYRRSVLAWLDKTGPFMDDDREQEQDDYFEYQGLDVTESGLGEAARRTLKSQSVATFSFPGSAPSFESDPLVVDHGVEGDRFGTYEIKNFWIVQELREAALATRPLPTSWRELIEAARERCPRLLLPDNIYQALSKEPFDAVVRDRALTLLQYLDDYMAGRDTDGREKEGAKEIINKFFVGDRALFSGESQTNQQKFRSALEFPDPDDPERTIFAHWHGKISHRFFRLHFEWPVPPEATRLKVLYLGSKLTKD